jgi:CspA family cold shock protein
MSITVAKDVPGRCKWFNDEKGFGFVRREGGEDVFVHYSQIDMHGRRTLEGGQAVVMDIIDTERGPQAHNVRPGAKEEA